MNRSDLAAELDSSADAPRERRRQLADRLTRYGVGIGGIGVIAAIVLIFFYLVYIVLPLFAPAQAEPVSAYPLPGAPDRTLLLALDERAEMAVRYAGGEAVFFDTRDGSTAAQVSLGIEPDLLARDQDSARVALATADGRVLVAEHQFTAVYADGVRTLRPELLFPFGREPLRLLEGGPLRLLAWRDGEERSLFAAAGDGALSLVRYDKSVSLVTGERTLSRSERRLAALPIEPQFMLLSADQRRLYLADAEGTLLHYQIGNDGTPERVEQLALGPAGMRLTALRLLAGGNSLLAGFADGSLAQWFPVRGADGGHRLTRVRGFAQGAAVTALAEEPRRKGFFAADAEGRVGIYHTTAERRLLLAPMAGAPVTALGLSPRADALLAQDAAGRMHLWRVENPHPEVSWSALWGKVHYEGYAEPRYVWQSSAASNDFEPKFSLVPLAFGTLKAAFYAMLIAVPLAILGAIYTAYFMAPAMRRVVKPTVEIMEALPTVILGFLAGLWLAPLVEQHLAGFFALLLVLPAGILLFGLLWHLLPAGVRYRVPAGWEAALLLPVVVALVWLALALGGPLEAWLFGGDLPTWLDAEMGVDFDQRNAIVVGLAMGFAVIPTIFSIAEDAVFSVPRHLTFGSLALGATPWQTLSRVVILTASPGIFAAVMIGTGRAVGETMIVLMATGNTPVMDFSVFQGMRTLSANIAVELPESEVASTHYRVLFLAALVLFVFTFVVNTVAEVVRQHLRRRYGRL